MATSQVETVSTGADKAKLGAAVALVIAALAGFYLLGTQGPVAQWGALLVGLAAAFVVFMTSESGKEFVAFGRDSWKEVKKVVWPTRKEAIQMTLYVFAFVRRHGPVPVADRQDPRVGVLRPDPGLEEVMSDITDTPPSAVRGRPPVRAGQAGQPGHALVRGARLFGHGKGRRAQHPRAHQPRRHAGHVRRDPGAHRRSGRDQERPEAHLRAPLLSRATCWCR